MMSNKNSLDAKCPRTNAYGVAGPGGDVRKYVTTAGASFIICTATSSRSERRTTICGYYEAQILARIRVQVRVSETPNHAVLYAGNHFFVCTCRILPHTSYYTGYSEHLFCFAVHFRSHVHYTRWAPWAPRADLHTHSLMVVQFTAPLGPIYTALDIYTYTSVNCGVGFHSPEDEWRCQ